MYSPDVQKLLALREISGELVLPAVTPLTSAMCRWEFDCGALTKMVEEEFGVEGTILSSLRRLQTNDHGNEELILVFDVDHVVNSNEADRKTWISKKDVCNFVWKPVESHVQTMQILLDFFHTQASTRADLCYPVWRTFGWFRCAKKWVFDVLGSQGYDQLEIGVARNTESSSILVVDAGAEGVPTNNAKNLKQRFFVKTCVQDSREALVTYKISTFAKDFVPEVVATSDNWKSFVQNSAGSTKFSPDPVLLLTTLARMHRISMPHLEDLMESGIKTFSMEWTIANVEKVLRYPGSQYYEKTCEEVSAQHVSSIRRLFQELHSENLPMTLVHGDIHLGNIAKQQNPPSSPPTYRIFDYGSAFLGNPLLDVYVLLSSMETNTEDMYRALEQYMHIWRWKMPIVYFKRMLHIAGLCYWFLDFHHTIQWQQKVRGEDIQSFSGIDQRIARLITILQVIEAR